MKPFPLAATLFLGSVTLAVADAPGADWMTKEQVTQKLQAMGYTDMRKLEAEGGHWEGTPPSLAYLTRSTSTLTLAS